MTSVNQSTDVALMQRIDRFEENFLPSFLPVIQKTWAKSVALNQDRFGQITMQVLLRKPKLMLCETMSIVASLRTCAEYSLYPDDLRGHVYLIPRWDKDLKMYRCNFMLGYRGLVTLFRRSTIAAPGKAVSAERVYEGDEIHIEKGLDEKLVHIPNLDAQNKPDRKLRLAYAILRYNTGETDFDYTMGWQIDEIRDHISDGAESDYSPWKSKSDLVRSWMEKKTPLRQVLKLSPALDDTMAGAVSLDEKADAGVEQIIAAGLDKQITAVAQKLIEVGTSVDVPIDIKASETSGKKLDEFIAQKKGDNGKNPEPKTEAAQTAPESKTDPEKPKTEEKKDPPAEKKRRGRPPKQKTEPTAGTKTDEAGPFEVPHPTETEPVGTHPAGEEQRTENPATGPVPEQPKTEEPKAEPADEATDVEKAWLSFIDGPT